MCKIIPFPVQETTGFINLKQFFEVSGIVKTTEFYLGTAEELARQNKITQSELLTLRRIGRQKLKTLESQTAAPVAVPGLYMFNALGIPEAIVKSGLQTELKHFKCSMYWSG